MEIEKIYKYDAIHAIDLKQEKNYKHNFVKFQVVRAKERIDEELRQLEVEKTKSQAKSSQEKTDSWQKT